MLHVLLDWSVHFHSREGIKGAYLIADSVIKVDRFQSYIARGYPLWLRHIFLLSLSFFLLDWF